MDPVTGGLIGAGVGAAGDLLGGAMTGAANAKEAEKNRHWQAMMAGSAHQRQVADMRAAGLNPILSGMGGSGASSGSGAQASMPDLSNIGSRTVGSAKTAQQYQIDKPHADIAAQKGEFLKTTAGKEFVEASAIKDMTDLKGEDLLTAYLTAKVTNATAAEVAKKKEAARQKELKDAADRKKRNKDLRQGRGQAKQPKAGTHWINPHTGESGTY